MVGRHANASQLISCGMFPDRRMTALTECVSSASSAEGHIVDETRLNQALQAGHHPCARAEMFTNLTQGAAGVICGDMVRGGYLPAFGHVSPGVSCWDYVEWMAVENLKARAVAAKRLPTVVKRPTAFGANEAAQRDIGLVCRRSANLCAFLDSRQPCASCRTTIGLPSYRQWQIVRTLAHFILPNASKVQTRGTDRPQESSLRRP